MKKIYFLFAILLLASCSTPERNDTLWYEQPADKWLEALPIGNGRLGAMLYGGADTDRIALNEITLWSGQFDPKQEKPFGKKRLAELRKLFFEGKLSEGNSIAHENLKGNYNSFGTHLPMGEVKMNFAYPEGEKPSSYKRTLNLENAIHTVEYSVGKVQYKREYFSTNPDDVMLIRLTASQPKAISFALTLDLLREAKVATDSNVMEFTGKVNFHMHGPGGVDFIGKIAIAAEDGKIVALPNALEVAGATNVTLVVDVRTNYKNPNYKARCNKAVQQAQAKPYEVLKSAHVNDYAKLYDRVELNLGHSSAENLPTDRRLALAKSGKPDVALDALFFSYGRYLLIAASRENSPLPAPLQGLWNDNLACHMGWTNDYHLDINTQQNYWLANVGNLAECHTPLFSYIGDLAKHGEKTAQKVYGCRGWCAHTVANVWGYSAPSQSIWWGLFPLASSWIASHLWTQYRYTQDKEYLANVAYPLLKKNALFLLDFMVRDPKSGYLMTGPCISPENSFRYKGENMCASMMPTGDRMLAYEILTSCVSAATILNVDKSFADSVLRVLSKLPPIKIGKNGAIQEWFEDYEEAQPNHRHTMQLLGLYPFNQISPSKTPELARAAEKVIQNKLNSEGWEDTEWSRANLLCCYARLKKAENAYESLQGIYKEFARDNLFAVAPGGIAGAESDIFEFDANEAAPAGIAEMLVQSYDGYIELLPALPNEWCTGSFKGLCVEGGAEVDAAWKNGALKRVGLRATADNRFSLKLPATPGKMAKNGKVEKIVANANGLLVVDLKAGDILIFDF